MSTPPTPTTVRGLGEMGRALAAALVDAGHPTTVCNRSPDRTDARELAGHAAVVDAADYGGEGQQSLELSGLTGLVTASVEQGVSAETLEPVHRMIRRQITAGHGQQGLARIVEEIRSTR